MSFEQEIKVPDIGGANGVDVIEVLVKIGDVIHENTPLVTLESDKASMEIPAPMGGVVRSVVLKVGDKVSEGDVILILDAELSNAPEVALVEKTAMPPAPTEVVAMAPIVDKVDVNVDSASESTSSVIAGPAARRLARVLGINLADITGTGRGSRIDKEDIERYVKHRLLHGSSASGINIDAAPVIDFSQFGAIDVKPMSKIKRLTGVHVHRSWVTIPHVTQFDEADITELEEFRLAEAERAVASGYKLTMLAFVCKVVGTALAVYPQFNASLDASGDNLIYKQYCNIGIAVETPNGLVVPVIKAVNTLSVSDIAQEMARLSAKAREKGLMPNDMSGGCFTISSLGGIGGTAFTPIVNAPEVAILGLSRQKMQPVYAQGQFIPRLMLPLSLSYDHRVIDGAEAARFTKFIREGLNDMRRILL